MSNVRFSSGDLLINRYEIEAFHAAGGMQEVYRCFDRTLGRKVVLKTPKLGVRDRRFRRGAEMGARVNHSNIAATFDYFEDESLTFLVEEFIPGLDLAKRLEADFDYMDPSLAAHVIHHIVRALYEAHRVGICHRDLKPSNIMVSPDSNLHTIKLTDFGIAKLAENEIEAEMELFGKDESTLTTSNTLLGAVPYLAPECWANWREAGKPMDVWALGCIAYQLLVGEPPFGSGRAAIMKVAQITHSKKVDLKKPKWFGKHKSSELLENAIWDIIIKCIQVDSDNRPTAETLLADCDVLCYAIAERREGFISKYPIHYNGGGTSTSGNITDALTSRSYFFHASDFFGEQHPSVDQRVSFSIYPGTPNPRCSPVLLLRQLPEGAL